MRRRGCYGQELAEFAISYVFLFLPLTMMLIFTAQLLWVWHSIVDYTNIGARFAATHCYQGGGDNVRKYMQAHAPLMVDRQSFENGQAEIEVSYFGRDETTGELRPFPSCPGSECSPECVPDFVRVRIVNYQFRGMQSYLGLPAINLPNFQTSVAVQSAGCSASAEGVTCRATDE